MPRSYPEKERFWGAVVITAANGRLDGMGIRAEYVEVCGSRARVRDVVLKFERNVPLSARIANDPVATGAGMGG